MNLTEAKQVVYCEDTSDWIVDNQIIKDASLTESERAILQEKCGGKNWKIITGETKETGKVM